MRLEDPARQGLWVPVEIPSLVAVVAEVQAPGFKRRELTLARLRLPRRAALRSA